MGNNNYELVFSNASSYVIAAATVFVKTPRGDSEDSDTLIVDKVYSVVTVKRRYGFLEMSDRVVCSLRSEECLNGGRDVSGKVFDRGRLLELNKRYSSDYIRNSSNLSLSILTCGLSALHGSNLMHKYDEIDFYNLFVDSSYGLVSIYGSKFLVQLLWKYVIKFQILVWKEVLEEFRHPVSLSELTCTLFMVGCASGM